jgi:hypothetical protein
MIALIIAFTTLAAVVIKYRRLFSLSFLFKKEKEVTPQLVNPWNRRANGQYKRKIPVKRMGKVVYYFYR